MTDRETQTKSHLVEEVTQFRGEEREVTVYRHEPDFFNAFSPSIAEFVFRASKVLTDFRDMWIETHSDDPFAKGLEIDLAQVTTDGLLMGYLGVSEIDGRSYDYLPDKTTKIEEDPK